jgi:hypothetical protein
MRKVIPIREQFGLFHEPTLEEILSDPIVKAVMRADSVDPARLVAMLGRIADELQPDLPPQFQNPAYVSDRHRPTAASASATVAPRGA